MLITKWHEKIQEDINNEPITQEEIDKKEEVIIEEHATEEE